ncbi:MAG: chaperone modulator CbpM [Desulfovibrionales bacterium]
MSKSNIRKADNTMPQRSKKIIWVQMVDMTGIHPMRLGELIEIGWIEPFKSPVEEYLFSESDVYRIKKLVRICRDFEVSTLAATIIVDLLERIEDLQQEVKHLRGLL